MPDIALSNEIIIALAILIGFLVQTVTGFAGGLISLPLMMLRLNIAEAVAVVSVFNLSFSAIQVTRNRKYIDLNIYKELALPTVLGVIIGVSILSYGQPVILKKCLGVFLIAYIIYRYRSAGKIAMTKALSNFLGLLGGFFAGLFSSGAPPFVVYVVSKFEDPKEIRANAIGILAVTNVTRPILLVFTGVFTLQIFELALWGFPGFLVALFFGEKLFRRLSKEVFLHFVMVFLGVSALMLLIK